jgi:hypothetical protein
VSAFIKALRSSYSSEVRSDLLEYLLNMSVIFSSILSSFRLLCAALSIIVLQLVPNRTSHPEWKRRSPRTESSMQREGLMQTFSNLSSPFRLEFASSITGIDQRNEALPIERNVKTADAEKNQGR